MLSKIKLILSFTLGMRHFDSFLKVPKNIRNTQVLHVIKIFESEIVKAVFCKGGVISESIFNLFHSQKLNLITVQQLFKLKQKE